MHLYKMESEMKKRLFAATVAAVLLAVALTSCAAKVSTSPTPLAAGDPCAPLVGLLDPDSEVRGVWIASVWNIDYPSSAYLSDDELKAEIDDIIDNCKKLSLNTVFFQVRPACDALYKSDLFPVSQFLSADGKLSFDPLEYILDRAHHNKISVHAWVNPLRVTPGAGKLDSLPKNSPARVHPEYTVDYCGRIVLNAGIPEVRDLVSEGVREIVKRYDVDGVVFDDYFYPYPQNDDSGRPVPFDDGETFTKYGGGFSDVGDFRRDSVNKLVKACYDAVKETDPECLFGISPFGVWQNDDGSNGGSETRGLEAYKEIYSDASAWVKGGYVDYLSPQIYWQLSSAGTPFGTLADWWNGLLGGGNVTLWISHAAYRYEEGDWADPEGEMERQVTYARDEMAYRGSVFYGYAELKNNVAGVAGEIQSLYDNEIIYLPPAVTEQQIEITSHGDGETVYGDTAILTGTSDPGRVLYLNGKPVGRHKNGDFAVKVRLSAGENRFLFTQTGEEFLLTLYK